MAASLSWSGARGGLQGPSRASGDGKNIFYIGPVGPAIPSRPSTIAGGGEHPGRVRGVGVGVKAGLSPERLSGGEHRFRQVLRPGHEGGAHGPQDDYQPGFSTDLMYKGRRHRHHPRPSNWRAADGSQPGAADAGHCSGQGMNTLDNICVIKLIEEAAGIKVKPRSRSTEPHGVASTVSSCGGDPELLPPIGTRPASLAMVSAVGNGDVAPDAHGTASFHF